MCAAWPRPTTRSWPFWPTWAAWCRRRRRPPPRTTSTEIRAALDAQARREEEEQAARRVVAVGPDDDVPPLPPDFVPMAQEGDGEDQPLTPQEEFELDPDATRRYTDLQFGKDYQIQ